MDRQAVLAHLAEIAKGTRTLENWGVWFEENRRVLSQLVTHAECMRLKEQPLEAIPDILARCTPPPPTAGAIAADARSAGGPQGGRSERDEGVAVLACAAGYLLMHATARLQLTAHTATDPYLLQGQIMLAELALALPAGLLLLGSRRRRAAAGFSAPGPRNLLLTVVAGFAASLTVAGVAIIQAGLPRESDASSTRLPLISSRPEAADLPSALASIALLPALSEELVYRGVLLPAFSAWGAPAAVAISTAGFGLAHIGFGSGRQVSLGGVPVALVLGALLGVLRVRTGSLLPPVLLHLFVNATSFLLALPSSHRYGPPDPGLMPAGAAAMLVGLVLSAALLGQLRPPDRL